MLNILKDLKKINFILVCLFMSTLTLVGYSSETSKKEVELKKTLQAIVNEAKKYLPAQMSEYVIFEKAELDGSNRLIYTYTITNISIKKQKLTDSEIKELINESSAYETLKAELNVDTAAKEILDAGGEFEYIYNDVDGKELMRFVITKDNYK